MKHNPNDGGPAFPGKSSSPVNPDSHFSGLSKREWFAGMALQGLLANSNGIKTVTVNGRVYSYTDAAFILADGMLLTSTKLSKEAEGK